MKRIYKKLPLSINPNPVVKFSKWIEKLANYNGIHFDYLIHYLVAINQDNLDITNLMAKITDVPYNKIMSIKNDLIKFPWELDKKCILKNCTKKGLRYLKEHNIRKHNLGVKWINCVIDECAYKCKYHTHLVAHLADKHDIGVIWHHCETCGYKSKRKTGLLSHKNNNHKIIAY